jgi:choline/glycine/proline betaine transport protein
VYALVGLSLAFIILADFHLLLGLFFYPLGDKIYGRIEIIDILLFLLLYFLATSLGLGVQQIAAGLEHLFDIDSGVQTKLF